MKNLKDLLDALREITNRMEQGGRLVVEDFNDYTQILKAIGDGVQVQVLTGGNWVDAHPSVVLTCIPHMRPENFRIKPRSITIDNIPEPLREPPEHGKVFWVPMIHLPAVVNFYWGHGSDGTYEDWLAAGICFATKDEAEQARTLIRKIFGGTV